MSTGHMPKRWPFSPCEKPAGHFQRAIRKHGKRVERSDRVQPVSRRASQPGAPHFWVASEILDHLERVMDRLEDVANEIHGTMIKHD
jgi:hypothetical protein